jgi:NTP pyrophosphatase (non-canonical NTP hydrolase)
MEMDNEIVRLEELRVKIIQWADEKGILKKATPEKQFLKFMEETGELAKAILKSDSEEFIDAVGDVFVTIVVHAELTKPNGVEMNPFKISHYEESIDDICVIFGLMVEDIYCAEYESSIHLLNFIYLENESLANGKTFADCVEVAYNVIAGRTGEMINGTFVKDK